MRYLKSLIFCVFYCFFLEAGVFASAILTPPPIEKLFYLTNDIQSVYLSDKQLQQIAAHAEKINILAPQAFNMDSQGVIVGFIAPDLTKLVHEKQIKLMPLVTNGSFDSNILHTFLQNNTAKQRAIKNMLSLCEKDHLYGLQLDFEHTE